MLCLAVSLVVLGLASAQVAVPIPILDTDPGVRYNAASVGAPIRLDVALETNCPDSLAAWPFLKQAADFYGPDVLDLVVYQFQLPYHRWGHVCTQGFYAVQNLQGDQAALTYMEYILDIWGTYSGGATPDSTYNEILVKLATDANLATGVDPAAFTAEIGNTGSKAVFAWKRLTRLGASGTPWYYLNGVDLGVNYALTLEELQSLIDPLLN